MNMKFILLSVAVLGMPMANAATTNASSAVLHVYKAYLSENTDCTNPILLMDNGGSAQAFDMITNPTMGQGTVPAKLYKCIIIEMTDRIDFVPTTSTGNCVAGTTYTRYVCQAGTTTKNPVTGAISNCTGTSQTGEDRVWVYVSRAATTDGTGGSGYDACLPPTSSADPNNGVPLSTDIDASNGGGAFIFNLTNKVDGVQNPCDLSPPTMSFRSN